MVVWIVVATVVLGLLVLALAVRPVLAGLGPLRRAALALQRRQVEAEALQQTAGELQVRLEGLANQAGTAQRRLEVIKARKSG
ncbi:hypothetical protein [Plantactinospora sp. GCM10030261]|uniref:hypothetical protein n=1 Tax=Plantactinospora sp. GCM10030261 TaxID=3273420 RepID=UPI00360BDEB7